MLVAVSLVLAHLLVGTVRPDNPAARLRVHQGLLAWDGGWYQSIAAHGYAASGRPVGAVLPGLPDGGPGARLDHRASGWAPALVVVANLCALAAMAALVVLVRHDLGDAGLARRSVWLLALAPPAYSLVLGYADAALLLCAVVTVLAARTGGGGGRRRPAWWPVWCVRSGVLLVVPGAHRGVAGPADATATAGPPVARLGWRRWPPRWSGRRPTWLGAAQFGDAWLPFRVQQQSGHRGAIDPARCAPWGTTCVGLVHGHHLGSALHVPWVMLCVVLLVVAFRRLPALLRRVATAVLAVSLTSSNLDSFERYALGAFPLVIAAST